MKYMLLIYDDTRVWEKFSEAEKQKGMDLYMKFTQEVKSGGHYVASSQLQPASVATTVRTREGKRLVTDGPYAETREQLGGYYMIEANNLDEAIAIAERVPSAQWGAVEVRPIVERPAQATA
ncbi:MAG: hypothetical protein DMG39_22640 [Acidobacteria bacterium]|nr:MAG: hypothetical protein DMG39_22640 [Acidobacteriota bacterium]